MSAFTDFFSQPGLGGREGDIKELGANPSVIWNSYVERWLMIGRLDSC